MDCHGLLLTAMDYIGLPWTGMDGVQWTARGCHGLLPWTAMTHRLPWIAIDSDGLPLTAMEYDTKY